MQLPRPGVKAASSAKMYGFLITSASQMAWQANGVTPMDVIGKVHCSLPNGKWTFELDALVFVR